MSRLESRPVGARMMARAMLLAMVFTTLLPMLAPSQAALAAGAPITGTAFRDIDMDGNFDAGSEVGAAGIVVTAYDANGVAVGTTTTRDGVGSPSAGAPGTYSLTTTDTGSGPYRLEFSIPAALSFLQPGPLGPSSGSTVQIVSSGGTANVGVINPSDYCANPRLVVSCFARGDNSAPAVANTVTIYDYPYSDNGTAVVRVPNATATNVGTIYGLAHQRSSNRLYAGSYIRRGASLGSTDSTGAIYVINRATTASSLFLDLNGFDGINTGVNPHPRGVVGYNWNVDTPTYGQVGKIGLGDLDISDDEQTLYVVNLNEKTLVVLPFGPGNTAPTAAAANSYTIPVPASCAAANYRPFALEYHDGTLYAGAVCAGPALTDLRAYVYSFNPLTATFSAAPILDIALNYPRRHLNEGFTGPNGDGEWNPWNDSWPPFGPTPSLFAYPQPMLTDIEFDGQGFMMLGLRDRFADQAFDTGDPGPTNGSTFNTRQGGDILLACQAAAGTWALESAGSCAGKFETRATADPNRTNATNNNSGPGNAEFYYQEHYDLDFVPDYHRETGMGSLALLPGSRELVSTVYDTFTTFEAGTTTFSNTSGSRARAVQVYPNGSPARFGKAGGLGDVELLCDLAPIEIGNRIWFDTDEDGIQDSFERGIPGVTLHLYSPGGPDGNIGTPADNNTPIGTVVTDGAGVYRFSSAAGADVAGVDFGITQILPNAPYSIALDLPANYTSPGILAGMRLSVADAGGAPADIRDSDATLAAPASPIGPGNYPTISLTTGGPGANNHTYDIGLFAPISIGDRVWFDTNNNGLDDEGGTPGSAAGIDGVIVELFFDANNDGALTGAEQTPVATQTTAAGGYYLFTQRDPAGDPLLPPIGLEQGQYLVGIRPSNFTGGALVGYHSSGTTISAAGALSDAPAADPNAGGAPANPGVDFDENGDRQAAGFYAGGVLSKPFSVFNTEPLGEPATPGRINQAPSGTPVTDARSNATVDFGFYQQQLGSTIWNDLDNSGDINPADGATPGIAGVAVRLFSADGTTQIPVGADGILGSADDGPAAYLTDASGSYLFSGLPAGAYVVEVDTTSPPLAGLGSSTGPAQSAAPDNNIDGDDNGTIVAAGSVRGAAITLTPGSPGALGNNLVSNVAGQTTNPTLDFGFLDVGSLGDFVWLDLDADGAQDAGEPGIPNVTVYLDLNGNGARDPGEPFDATDSAGAYLIGGLGAGSYTVRVDPATLPAGLAPSFDLDGIVSPNVAAGVTLAAGQDRTDVDFGYRGTGSIGDFVWLDRNADGVQDVGEPGIPGAAVTVAWAGPDNAPGTADDISFPTTTDAAGIYGVTNLPAGTYQVTVSPASLPGGVVQTYDLDGIGSANSAAATLAAGQNRTDVDFGYRGNGSLGDFIWLDRDADGAQEPGEPGIPGVTVFVDLNSNGTRDAGEPFATTDAAGAYLISGLGAGTYPVRVDTASVPAGLGATYDLDGGNDSFANAALAAGQNRTDVDFGYRGTASLGDFVWLDQDGDGTQDAGEPGIFGVTVYLDLNSNGAQDPGEPFDITDASGLYLIDGLGAGSYSVRVNPASLPGGLAQTYDLDGIGTPNAAAGVALATGENRVDVDFGYRGTGSIGDFVWNDLDADGVQDGGETGLPSVGVTVTWAGADNTFGTSDDGVYTASTSASGAYSVGGLPAGSYQVDISTGTLPAGFNPTYDLDGIGTPSTASTTLAAGQNRTDVDFGYNNATPPATGTIGDRVWSDTDGDGVQDAGELGIPGVTVTLTGAGPDGIFGTPDDQTGFAPQVTDASGLYQFTSLPAGNYRVTIGAGVPAGLSPSFDRDGLLDGMTEVALAVGQSITDADFGYTSASAGALGDRIWNDTDADGVQDAGETGIPGVTVTLTGAGPDGTFGTADDTTATDITDANGVYGFDSLPAGQYRVAITAGLPAGLTETYELDGSRDQSTTVALGTGMVRTDVDFGFASGPVVPPTGSLGDLVWLDLDADGVQDAGEAGIAGVTINILWYGVDGIPGTGDDLPYTSVTDAAGNYTVTGLAAGTYQVNVDPASLPGGLAATFDLDGIVTPHTAEATLAAGQNRTDVDFGYRGAGSLGDRVWSDLDADGVQDAGEPGIAGVTVTLTGAGSDGVFGTADDTTATDTTDATGLYGFSNLAAGQYQVAITTGLPGGLTETYELDGSLNGTTAVALGAGQNRTDVDFGYTSTPLGALGSLGDFVWLDLDGDGIQDLGEPGLADVNVVLIGAGADTTFGTGDDTTFIQATTASGGYLFSGLQAGLYRASIDTGTLPAGLAQTYDLDGLGSANSADATLAAGQNRTDVDFGYRGTGSIGDFVWNDLDGDGTQDVGEAGIGSVPVTLTWAGDDGQIGTADDVTFTTTTDPAGAYSFSGLPAGSYRVTVDTAGLPAGMLPTYDLDGGLNNLANVGLTPGQIRTDVDFGYVVPAIDLAIAKDDGGLTTLPGGVVVYTLTYANNGNYAASGVVISETVPANASFNAAASTPGWSCAGVAAGSACTFTIGNLARGAGGTVAFAVTTDTPIPAGVAGLSNTAGITDSSGFGADTNPADNSASDTTPISIAPDLRITIQLSNGPTVEQGGIASYLVTYGNIGTQDATGTVITVVVPANTTFSAAGSTPGWSCSDGAPAGTVCTFLVGSVPVGATGTLVFVAQIDDPIPANVTTIVISASIADDGTNGVDPTPVNNAAATTASFIPTAVTLVSFTAAHTSAGVLVRWTTSAEIDTWGFHIYRSTTGQRADAVRATTQLIPATGNSTSGDSYSWIDTDAEPGVTYTYWLEEVELAGASNEYGPVSTGNRASGDGYQVMLPLVVR